MRYCLVELYGPPGRAPEDDYDIQCAINTAEDNETAGAWAATSDRRTWIRHDPGMPALAVRQVRTMNRRTGWVVTVYGTVSSVGYKVRLYADAQSAMKAAEAYYAGRVR
jgi:hypothetical protein